LRKRDIEVWIWRGIVGVFVLEKIFEVVGSIL
jgi:hypothetical protein